MAFGHPILFVRIQRLFGQEEAIGAIDIAGGPARLRQQVEARRGAVAAFGIANQLLAAIALCVGTTIFIKMHRARYLWITAVPLAWLLVVTFTAGYQKIFSDQPRVGFLSEASHLQSAIDAGSIGAGKIAEAQGQIFNDRLDAAVCGMFLIMVALILVDSVRVWFRILTGTRESKVREAPFVCRGCRRRNCESVLARCNDSTARDRR